MENPSFCYAHYRHIDYRGPSRSDCYLGCGSTDTRDCIFAHVIAATPLKTGLGTPSSSGLTLFLSSFEGLVSKFSIVDLAPGVWKLLLVVVSQLDVATYTGRPPKKGRGRVVC